MYKPARDPLSRTRVSLSFDPEGDRTLQSFREEVNINSIVDRYQRTGDLPVRPGEPQYGEVPETSLFEAAVAQAEIRSAVEDGWEPPESPSEPSEGPEGPDPVPGNALPDENAVEGVTAPQGAAPDESSGKVQ